MKQADADRFWNAAQDGDLKTVERMLASIDAANDRKVLDRALHLAVFDGHAKVVDRLLPAGANPETNTPVGSVLIAAAMNGDLAIVKRLVEAGANTQRKVKGETPLSAALSENQTSVVEFLQKSGALAPSAALMNACQRGDLAAVRAALDGGADIEFMDRTYPQTPLMKAARGGHADVVQELLRRGAKVNRAIDDRTAIFDAVSGSGNVATVMALVEGGADMHVDFHGETVLMAAAAGGHVPVVKKLIELGLDPEVRDARAGLSLLDYAKRGKSKEVVRFLNGLGATSERDTWQVLARALACEFGGKPAEHVSGFLLNANFAERKAQFSIASDHVSLHVHGLKARQTEFQAVADSFLVFCRGSAEPSWAGGRKFVELKAASGIPGVKVFRLFEVDDRLESFAQEICTKLRRSLKEFSLAESEALMLGGCSASLLCPLQPMSSLQPRWQKFAALLEDIYRPPAKERVLFEQEWLLKPAKKGARTRHQLGGQFAKPVSCPHCESRSNLVAQIDLTDPALLGNPLPFGGLPVFWCLDCGEWGPDFFEFARGTVFALRGGKRLPPATDEGADDLDSRAVTVTPAASGKRAGRKSKLGGKPAWLQADDTPDCPKCEQPMGFVLQLASDSRVSFGDVGMLYTFACPECAVTASLVQSH
jgi:ankyrin repeat protein